MLDFIWYSMKLFFQGKLLSNPGYFYRQLTLGIILGLVLLISLGETGMNLGFVVAISSLIMGMTMPFLLKDVKMQ
ncbi:MAG TPA: hypothetical protein DCF68_09860 [Cyanothece sp. UBA12306]|nr:hypothetical protein [Cyanothece sp. UBA12306]